MEPTFELRSNILPVPWMQPGRTRGGHRFTPRTLRQYKQDVAAVWNLAYPDAVPLTGPVKWTAEFRLPRTKAQSSWKKKPQVRLWHTKKPDLTNLEKSVEDALTGLAWRDDSQVCMKSTFKIICAGHEQPGFHIKIWELE